jgi:glycine/D-amino acid oxidase-like deaminating enzyme
LPDSLHAPSWGIPPWSIDFQPAVSALPDEVDFAVVGGGFSGLSAAAWLRCLDPRKTVAMLEAESIGAGSSGHSGGMTLAETSAGDLPGLGDVLAGFSGILHDLEIDCDLTLPGAWELGRKNALPGSPISWSDSGNLRAVAEVPGGSADPGKLVSGLARAAHRAGVLMFENARVENVVFGNPLRLDVGGKQLRAARAIFATNAQSLEVSGLAGRSEPKFTLAMATERLTPEQLEKLGLASRKPFYTTDFPYLWGRLLSDDGVVFGSGLVHLNDWRELARIDIAAGEPADLLGRLERRVRGLHPALRDVRFTHRWGGPILIGEGWRPVFAPHPQSSRAVVLGAYCGHGVALSVYLGRWAAEASLGRRDLPQWEE